MNCNFALQMGKGYKWKRTPWTTPRPNHESVQTTLSESTLDNLYQRLKLKKGSKPKPKSTKYWS